MPTTAAVRRRLAAGGPLGAGTAGTDAQLIGEVTKTAAARKFFHWKVEFPDVFAPDSNEGGFDVVLGNPPWERIKLQEKEFFASKDAEIAQAPNKAERDRRIKNVKITNPSLYEEFENAKHTAESQSRFVRGSERFPLCGRGDVNLYSVFTETARTVLSPKGRAGFLMPTGIATDDTTKDFFADLMDRQALVSLHDFENKNIFPQVHSSYKFCLLSMGGAGVRTGAAEFAFFLHAVADLQDENRRFTLTKDDIALFNPNTRTAPIFRTRRDAEITRGIYERVPVLIDESKGEEGNPWGIKFMAMFHMSNDSGLFRTRAQLEAEGYTLDGNVFRRGDAQHVGAYGIRPSDAAQTGGAAPLGSLI